MDLSTFEELKGRLDASGMSKPAFIGIAAVILIVALIAGGRLVETAAANDFEVSKAAPHAEESSSASEEASSPSLFVHVSGAVVNPGLFELDGGARVADAVNAAGGFADDAATSSVNLARTLIDGEQVIVASRAEQEQAAQASAAAADAGGASAALSGLVNINTANAVELISLPGIGEATASKIVADRQANGPFKSVDDLKRVSGVGDRKFDAISGLICV